jgi:hypothetical protein
MKKVALFFRGLTNYFLESYENINSFIIQDMKKTFDVDIFLNTYKTDLHDTLIDKLHPVKILYNNMRTEAPMQYIIPTQIIECCELVKNYEIENNINYDYIIITRFDLTFNNAYSEYNIDYNKINMECMFVPNDSSGYNSGDNFFLFQRSYLDLIIDSVRNCLKEKSNSHQLFKYFLRNKLETHYICGETTMRNPEYNIMFIFTRYLHLHRIKL